MKLNNSLLLAVLLFFSGTVFAQKVNINTANAEMIASTLTGIGQSKAQAIVDYRSKNGKFKSVEDLENVDGIGEKTVAKNKDRLSL